MGSRKPSRKVTEINDSPTLAVSARAKQMKRDGIDVIDFGAGQPDFDVPDHVKAAAVEAISQPGSGKYTAADGMIELKQAIISKLGKDNDIDYTPGQVIVSPGAKFCLFAIIQAAVNEGDEVIIPRPYWVSYPEMVRLAGGKPVYVDTDPEKGFKLEAEAVERAITDNTGLIIINSPNNPTGAVYDREEVMKVMKMAAAKTIHVISDEIYEKLIYDDKRHVSPASFGPEYKELVFTVNGMSKSHAVPGWRIGYAAGPEAFMRAAARLQSHSSSNPTSIVQMAFSKTLDNDGHIKGMRTQFKNRRDFIVKRLNEMGFKCVKPEGAFYVFPKLPGRLHSSEHFCKDLLEEAHVACTPGSAFGMDGYVRISYAASMDHIKEGMDRIEKFVKKK
jgi:aspartate aminotransferase